MAKQQENKEQPVAKKHLVISEFRDLDNFNLCHTVGKDVSDFEPERLAKLIELGLVS